MMAWAAQKIRAMPPQVLASSLIVARVTVHLVAVMPHARLPSVRSTLSVASALGIVSVRTALSGTLVLEALIVPQLGKSALLVVVLLEAEDV